MDALLHIALSNAVACGVMAAVLLPLARWLRRPALTHALAALVLLKLLTPPLFDVPVKWPAMTTPRESVTRFAPPAATPVGWSGGSDLAPETSTGDAVFDPVAAPTPRRTAASPKTAPASPLHKTSIHWQAWLLLVWAATGAALMAVTLYRTWRLGRAVRRATVSGGDAAEEVGLLSARLGIRQPPAVRFIAGSSPPMLVGWRRPELVVPLDLWDRLDEPQRRTLLLHELAHLRRGDHRLRLLELLATCAYWWHPAVWFARGALRQAEEQCCDAWVVWALPEAAKAYMTTILDTVDFLSRRSLPRFEPATVLASGMGQFHDLQRRLTMVRERRTQRRLGVGGLAAVVMLGAVALPAGARLARGEERSAGAAVASSSAAATADATPAVATDPFVVGEAGTAAAPAADPRQADASGDQVARLEAELAAARQNVERLSQELRAARGKARGQVPAPPATGSPFGSSGPMQPGASAADPGGRNHKRATLGYLTFKYDPTGAVLAFHDNQLAWKLDVPLNADSVIACYDNDTLIIKSADGYTRLVTPDDGHVIQAWAPGVEAPAVSEKRGVNPFGVRPGPENSGTAASSAAAPALSGDGQNQEKRIERIEQTLRLLTEAVDQLSHEHNQGTSSSPANR